MTVTAVVLGAGAVTALPVIDRVAADEQVSPTAASIPSPYLVAYQQAAGSVNPPIPWEILAGIGRVTTDHGRLSPYDDTDRASAPATTYPDVVPPIGMAGSVGATAPSSALATDVANLPVFLAAERQVESHDDYTAADGDATGAYQYTSSTWASEARAAGFAPAASAPAADAPPAVQDAVAAADAQQLFDALHNWYWVAEAWYDPGWEGDPAEQDAVPDPAAGNTRTMAGYATSVLATMAATTGGRPSPPAMAAPAPVALREASVRGTGPLLLSGASPTPPGADLQNIDTAAGVLAQDATITEEQAWRDLRLPSSVVDEPLSDPTARRFWGRVLARLPVAAGVGIAAPRSNDDGYATPVVGPRSVGGAGTAPAAGPVQDAGPGATRSGAGQDPMARFAADLLANLADPVTRANVAALQAWASGEGSSAAFNPLDTTQPEPGATPYNNDGGAPVENYPDYRTGLAATVATLEPGGRPAPPYQGILAALQSGRSTAAVDAAVAASPWGTRQFPNPSFPALANFPGFPGSVPSGSAPVRIEPNRMPVSADGAVRAGTDAESAADELTMAEYYAGVITDPVPASGQTYTPRASVAPGFGLAPGTPGTIGTVIHTALAQLGKPYVYGATGPDAYDCSGLVVAAYAAAGIALPRTTYDQVGAGAPVPLADPSAFRPGDLLFIMGSDPEGSLPGHVGLYLGDGQVIDAPYTGTVIRISPLASWLPALVAVRRIVPS